MSTGFAQAHRASSNSAFACARTPGPTFIRLGMWAAVLWTASFGQPFHSDAVADEPTGFEAAAAVEKWLVAAIAKTEKSVVAIARVRNEVLAGAGAFRGPLSDTLRGAAPVPTDADFVPHEYGAGVVVDAAGQILTNYHLLGDPETSKYFVWIQQRPFPAQLVAADPWYDLAILKIEARVPPMPLGDGSAVRKGQIVLALGNPQAIARDGEPSVSWGIVSNVLRRAPRVPQRSRDPLGRETVHHYGTLIQTDAKLNAGFSGGALVNLQGQMIGLTTSYAAGVEYETAAGFAIPVDERFRRVVAALREGRKPDYGFLGVAPEPVELSLRQRGYHGAVVARVLPGTPAARSGLRKGDLISHIDGEQVFDDDDLIRLVAARAPDGRSVLTIIREHEVGRTLSPSRDTMVQIEVTLSKKYLNNVRPQIGQEPERRWRGLQVDYVTAVASFEEFVNRIDLDGCVVVQQVDAESPAWSAGIRPGNLISRVQRKQVSTPGEFYDAVADLSGTVSLRVTTNQGLVELRTISP